MKLKHFFNLLIIYTVAFLVFVTALSWVIKAPRPWNIILIIIFTGMYTLILLTKYYPEKHCNTCGGQLLLPWGTDHLWCALRHHPVKSIKGWAYIALWKILKNESFRIREEALKDEIRKEAIKKGLRKV